MMTFNAELICRKLTHHSLRDQGSHPAGRLNKGWHGTFNDPDLSRAK